MDPFIVGFMTIKAQAPETTHFFFFKSFIAICRYARTQPEYTLNRKNLKRRGRAKLKQSIMAMQSRAAQDREFGQVHSFSTSFKLLSLSLISEN